MRALGITRRRLKIANVFRAGARKNFENLLSKIFPGVSYGITANADTAVLA